MVNPLDLVGRPVGRYTVLRHLASGGMAELFIARQQAVGGFEKQVVLKILQPRYAQNTRVVQMFLDEARLAAKLNHPAIVHVYDVADEAGLKYIAMEYIHGETIADIVKRGLEIDRYLPMEHAIHIVRQSAAGLAYAHERREADGRIVRIVHRDVSPTNILVSYEGQTEIVDFGIARAQDELREETGILPGKASYMSPEQIRGEAVDPRSDIFALGIILYELTLCQRLYRGPAAEVMKRIVDDRIAPPTAIRRDYPAALELIVMRALEKRPGDRYQSAQEMHDDLEEFLSESGLRSGNRRVALYLAELFAEGGSAARGATEMTATDLAATEMAAEAMVAELGEEPMGEEGEPLDFDRRAPLSMRIQPAAAGAQPAVSATVVSVSPSAGPAAPLAQRPAADAPVELPVPSARGSWIALAALIALAIGAMVILTLR